MYKDAEAHKAELIESNECNGAVFKIRNDPAYLEKSAISYARVR